MPKLSAMNNERQKLRAQAIARLIDKHSDWLVFGFLAAARK